MTLEEIEKNIREEADKLLQSEPLSVLMIKEQVTSRKDFTEMLSVTLSCQLAGEVIDRNELERMFNSLYASIRNWFRVPARTCTLPLCVTRLAPTI